MLQLGLQEFCCKLDDVIVRGFPLHSTPQPFIPFLAPSPMTPFFNNSTPKLSGRCTLNFSAVDSLISTTAVDCLASFAPLLANVICCPQFQATLVILIGQSSKNTGMLALDSTHANYCLSDFQRILESRGASDDLEQICSIHPLNLTEGSCPVNDISEFESAIDSAKLLAACGKVDAVNECCSQICQNAIREAARKIALRDGGLTSMDITDNLHEHYSRIDGCRSIVLRWLSSRLDPLSAKHVLRQISNCNVNEACPLVFPDTTKVAEYCGNRIKNHNACCNAMDNYVSHLQKQSFITNLQALDCASLLGLKLQKMNVTTNIYSLCQITLKDFSLQVGSQESGCLLPSLPSDAMFDPSSGISFTCDLNDNIAAPWPSAPEAPTSSCNKSINLPELPAATSAHIGENGKDIKLPLAFYLICLLFQVKIEKTQSFLCSLLCCWFFKCFRDPAVDISFNPYYI
ncbi:uncharacterized GPI-anchored protein At1g61900 isoform X2 [Phoenix dactylifera]|uniref:Uncharacterized GPI-anchored protein At1g61900 isoform X2 n=1 Tax=Phoenix dactylifera TaxID=42345 RepID=A0A8B8IZN7_PHODC|nr:uncharacterized GPI-anchored protein At1g61900 isoform X2 [Phoenix dactylifera]XP_026655919.2 uncharacterized GPI-anchored protein At1g61900 isoform X2 [Phoenix dactylifera]XP_026655920.2 uncharacterized GPI-anchored protein At1g61900 isoform X2 [Phoenix dactylifera]XP_026655921.2 uncharacterized GPI-anchored protein At1g61900 isoform X2 [Phoenix dactylifera]XP_038981936.1 uncharacterized GPI-anchored protein At1g61900 isoform X2 [Phoenix dactylifera]